MAVRVSDNLKTQNDSTEFPVAFGDSIWLNKDKSGATENYSDLQTMYNNDELGNGGSSIQVDTMPIASVDELGKIYEFIGSTGTYVNGYFYECVSDGEPTPTYSWVQKNVQPNATGTLPVANGGTGVTSQADINKAFIGNLTVGNDDVTDGTEFVSSWASDNGFAETADATAFTDDEGGDFPLTSEAIQLISGVDANLARVIRYGKLVIVALDSITSTSAIQQYTIIASGLPVPYTGASEAGQNVASGRITASTYLYVSNVGTLCVGVGGWDGSRGDGSIVYVTND